MGILEFPGLLLEVRSSLGTETSRASCRANISDVFLDRLLNRHLLDRQGLIGLLKLELEFSLCKSKKSYVSFQMLDGSVEFGVIGPVGARDQTHRRWIEVSAAGGARSRLRAITNFDGGVTAGTDDSKKLLRSVARKRN